MNKSHLLLICILLVIMIIIFNQLSLIIGKHIFENEHINNDLPDNQITQLGDANLLIPTSDEVYNPNDQNRPDNADGHQVTDVSNNINTNTELVNTSLSIPIVYTHDELEVTNYVMYSPSQPNIVDAGSGQIVSTDNVNNNALNDFSSIE